MGSEVFTKHPPHSEFGGRKVLNIGCGWAQYPAPNVVNVDAYGQPDLRWDLRVTPLPFESGTVDLILANHIMEHLPVEKWWALFEDFARMLKVGGEVEIYVPGDGADSVFGYRDHVSMINACSFYGTFGTYRSLTNAWATDNAKSPANWLKSTHRIDYLQDKWWLKGPNWWKLWCRTHLRNVVAEQGFFFRKVTPEEMAEEETKIQKRATRAPFVASQAG